MNAGPRVFVVLLLTATLARGQQDGPVPAPCWPASDLPAHLAANDLRDVAWAGYFVQRDRVRASVPAVRAALARLAGHDDPDGQLARLQLLDALIQLDVKVPGEELLPHAVEYLRVPALILAAKATAANSRYFAARFAALVDEDDLEWQVCGNLLTSLREPGFALSCLWAFEFALRVTVTDHKPFVTGVG